MSKTLTNGFEISGQKLKFAYSPNKKFSAKDISPNQKKSRNSNTAAKSNMHPLKTMQDRLEITDLDGKHMQTLTINSIVKDIKMDQLFSSDLQPSTK